MPKRKKRYKHAKIGKKKYYFYSIKWLDITGDAGHNTPEEFDKFECAKMGSQAYVYKKIKSFFGRLVRTTKTKKSSQTVMFSRWVV